ncbi:MAG: redoxin domain-containing protein [Deltaproteobacteria bacterium]|nr:redoxin domain-containing protein [Deltaproteobacteria bacterium]MDD9853762.1 redoxin domain-containing protein [Deltaproteobacteria bacterium]MDD9872246.1 redoxin domain-containing protein [Deltaproteobacteria bacterium]
MRWLATLLLLLLLAASYLLPLTEWGQRGSEAWARTDVAGAFARTGELLPEFALQTLEGEPLQLETLRGKRVLLTFERSIDWCPPTKERLVELRASFARQDDVEIVWVMAEQQINAKARRFIDGMGLEPRVRFATDPGGVAVDALGIRKARASKQEAGIPHPATYLLDREGVVRFADVREDFRFWVAPSLLQNALREIP